MTNVETYVKGFEAKLNGVLGKYQQDEAVRDLGKRKCDIINGNVVFNEGVARWTTNNKAVPMECAVQFKKLVNDVDLELQQRAIDGDIRDFFANYKPHEPTAEEKAEMDANFEAGERIVDAITGDVVYVSKGYQQ